MPKETDCFRNDRHPRAFLGREDSMMNTDDFNKALKIGRHYFEMRGIANYWTIRALGEYIMKVYAEGERPPLLVANRAIVRLENQLALEEELKRADTATKYPNTG
jgi:hypothetical protein